MQLVLSKANHLLKPEILQPVNELIQLLVFHSRFPKENFAISNFYIFMAVNH